MVALDWVDLTNVASGIFISSVTGSILTMKRMGAVESDSVKSARKAKVKLHKACERASESCERTLRGQEQNNAHGKHEIVTRQ